MVRGVANRILRVNLSDGRIRVDEPDEAFYRTYLGGAGFVGYYLLKEMEKGADALAPGNVMVFADGPMTGTGMPGAPRNCIGAKSPLSGGFAKSEVGGFFGHELKRADFDAIVVEGKADKPVYLWVHEGEAEIRDASELWGKTVLEAHDAIEADLGQRFIRTALIGPGGENMVRMACVINDLRAAAGRGGLGAVMGSKNLKGIAAKGHKTPDMANPEKIREMAKWMNTHYGQEGMSGNARGLHDAGTGTVDSFVGGNATGNLPVRNWSDGHFEGAEKISATVIKETILNGMEACPGCQVRCKKVVEFDEPYKVNGRNGGPEYESLASFGSMCGIDDIKAVCRANELCSLYSLDTLSTGAAIAFGMECFEKEILTRADTGGIDLRFGNAEAMLQMIELIARRQGIGDLLAEGSRKAAAVIGKGSEEFSMEVKGVSFGMHEPRLKRGLGLLYAVNPHGGDHCSAIHDTAYSREGPTIETLRSLGVPGPLPVDDFSPAKVAMAKAQHVWRLFIDSLVDCYFVPWTISQQVDIIRAVTGWEYTAAEAMRVGERVATMGRAFNLREGLTAADDQLPKRFFSPTPRGALKDTAVDPEEFNNAVHTFYRMMGWDGETGVPTAEKLVELGISWVGDELSELIAAPA
ncbi:MAG: aldehyde ferredoxin oxidoreductase family protein [Dehalococcoidia bacterium]